MKTFKIFGKKIFFKIETQKESYTEKKESKFNPNIRLLTIASMFIFYIFFFKLDILKKQYEVGDISEDNIISPMTIEYEDNINRDFIINQIKNNTEPLYKLNDKIKTESIKKINYFFDKFFIFKKNLLEKNITDEEQKMNFYREFVLELDIILSPESIKKMIEMENEEIIKENVLKLIERIYEDGIEDSEISKIKEESKKVLHDIEFDIFSAVIEANKFYDEEATKENVQNQIKNIKNTKIRINVGDVIIKKGETIDERIKEKLEKTGIYDRYSNLKKFLGLLIYLFVISMVLIFLGKKYIKEEIVKNNIYYPTLISLGIIMLLLKIIHIKFIFLFPFGALILLLGIISSERYAYIIGGITLMFILPYLGFDQRMFIVNLVGMLVGMYYVKNIKNRTDIVNAGIAMGIAKVFSGIALNFIFMIEVVDIIWISVQFLLSGILAGMITMAILPYLENTFNILTDIKLLELGDFSNPLLKDLLIKAPGTFHHSILVATLSESAAEAIGANSTFTRVAAYYHDIGKMKRPTFFVENQFHGINPHDNINPYLSTLVITSHTRDGEKLARMHKIPKEIRDIMKEHQGTTLLAYFYNKASNESGDINEADFRYEGPKPKTKESAIIMLADSIEAAVRSLDNKNPVVVENIIRKIINGKIEDGQLSEAELTFKDIEIVIKTFVNVIKGIYHSRIKYPDAKK